MYAVFESGGKQYRVSQGQCIKVEKLDVEPGASVAIDKVLMVAEGGDIKIGTPYVAGGKVTATVKEQGLGQKIKIVKFRRRKQSGTTRGHRQAYTELEITDIEAD